MPSTSESNLRLLAWLTILVAFVGALATVSYASGASIILRLLNPSFGEWWDAHQFRLMEGAATAFGLLVGIRISIRFVGEAGLRSRVAIAAFVLAILALAPLTHLCSAVARFGWRASSSATESRLVGYAGYDSGKQLDKLLIAGIYFFKTAGFALMAGLALSAIAIAVSSALADDDDQSAQAAMRS